MTQLVEDAFTQADRAAIVRSADMDAILRSDGVAGDSGRSVPDVDLGQPPARPV